MLRVFLIIWFFVSWTIKDVSYVQIGVMMSILTIFITLLCGENWKSFIITIPFLFFFFLFLFFLSIYDCVFVSLRLYLSKPSHFFFFFSGSSSDRFLVMMAFRIWSVCFCHFSDLALNFAKHSPLFFHLLPFSSSSPAPSTPRVSRFRFWH